MGEPDMLSLQTPCLLEHCSFFQCTRLKKSILLLNHSSIPLHLRTAGTPQTCCFRASAEKSLGVPVTAWGAVSSARTVNDTLVVNVLNSERDKTPRSDSARQSTE